ncbi:hypothetical protein LTR16_012446, partial [Cryomyces antarcticus]
MSAKRVFSGARRTVSWERARLGGKVIEQTECLKHWIRNGLANDNGSDFGSDGDGDGDGNSDSDSEMEEM